MSVVLQIAETNNAKDVAASEHNNIKSIKRKNLPASD